MSAQAKESPNMITAVTNNSTPSRIFLLASSLCIGQWKLYPPYHPIGHHHDEQQSQIRDRIIEKQTGPSLPSSTQVRDGQRDEEATENSGAGQIKESEGAGQDHRQRDGNQEQGVEQDLPARR